MADDYVQVAPNSTGNKLRTVTSVVAGNTVHQQVVSVRSMRTRTGLYRVDTGVLAVAPTADAATAGKAWLVNPVGSTVAVAIKRFQLNYMNSAATAAANSPRLTLERVTFTGAPTGATVTPAKRVRTLVQGQAVDATAQASIRTASTGLTLTAGEMVRAWLLPGVLTAVGTYGGDFVWDPDWEEDELILAAGEGVVVRQADAATATTETRRITVSLTWEEFTAP